MVETVEGMQKLLGERVKHYEGKLATLTAINSALQTENEELQQQLEEARLPASDAAEDIADLQHEFQQRLGQADRSIAELREERDRLKAKLQLGSKGVHATEVRLAEKDDLIRSLREEGEELARKNGELEATVRKLRSGLRELEQERGRLASRLKQMEQQLMTVQETVANQSQQAGEQVEVLEAELKQLRLQTQKEVAASRREAAAAAEQLVAARGDAEALAAARSREEALGSSLSQLRESMASADADWSRKLEDLEAERVGQQEQLRELQRQKEELEAQLVDATKPLLKQVQGAAAAHAAAQQAAAEREQQLLARVRAAEESASSSSDAELSVSGKMRAVESALAASRQAAKDAIAKAADAQARLEAEQRRGTTLRSENDSLNARLQAAKAAAADAKAAADSRATELQERVWELEDRLRGERKERDALSARVEQLTVRQLPSSSLAASTSPPPPASRDGTASPPLADGEGQAPEQGPPDGLALLVSGTGPAQSHPGSNGSKSAGSGAGSDHTDRKPSPSHRISQLQSWLRDAEAARDVSEQQQLKLLRRVEELEASVEEYRALQSEHASLRQRFDYSLAIIGERNERVSHLEDELKEAKRIFREQYSIVVDRLNAVNPNSLPDASGPGPSGGGSDYETGPDRAPPLDGSRD